MAVGYDSRRDPASAAPALPGASGPSVQQDPEPISGANSMGFFETMGFELRKERAFKSVKLRATGLLDSLIDVTIVMSPHVQSVQEIAWALRRRIQDSSYCYFQAMSLKWYREATVARFTTLPDADSCFVTGTITVSGRRYPKLVARCDKDFGWFEGPLESMPAP